MNEKTLELIKDACQQIEEQGHGEVVIKIRNGCVWRLLQTNDVLVQDINLTNSPKCVKS